ncbi:hypothetical protein V2J09_008268, partial [Rumex salicifolius]
INEFRNLDPYKTGSARPNRPDRPTIKPGLDKDSNPTGPDTDRLLSPTGLLSPPRNLELDLHFAEAPMKDINSLKVCFARTGSENGNGKLEELKNSVNTTVDLNLDGKLGVETKNLEELKNIVNNTVGISLDGKVGVEAGCLEVEYIESENLKDVEDLDSVLQNLLSTLESKDWVTVCEALNNVRRFTVFHKAILLEMLEKVIPLVVKSLKNPRSALCKTAIMTSSDIFSAYGDNMLDYLDPLLAQLLLKASIDKRFVCEAAETALIAMTTSVSPALLLPKLLPNLKHKNPRIRAKASMCFCKSVPRLGVDGITVYGIDKLIQIAASQLSDQLPESRESARTLLSELQLVYEKSCVLPCSDEGQSEVLSWKSFCQSKLTPLNALAVLRVTTTRDVVLTSLSSPQAPNAHIISMFMAIIISVVLLIAGIGGLILIHIYVVGRALTIGYPNDVVLRFNVPSDLISRRKATGMAKGDIEKLPCFTFSSVRSVSLMECAVCLESFEIGDKCRLLPPCSHNFHAKCVDYWLSYTPVCPVCRSSVTWRVGCVRGGGEVREVELESGTRNVESG